MGPSPPLHVRLLAQQDYVRPKVVLLGLEDILTAEFKRIVSNQSTEVCFVPSLSALGSLGPLNQMHAGLIFCSAKAEQYVPLLQMIERETLNLPVVVVSRLPEVAEWIEALEKGAADYCSPPFDSNHIQQILDQRFDAYPGTWHSKVRKFFEF
jgi:DNA-binding NtrC family response regulator